MDKIITKKDEYSIEIETPVKEIKTYKELSERKAHLEQSILTNEALYQANLTVNETALTEVNFLIAEAEKLGIVEKSDKTGDIITP